MKRRGFRSPFFCWILTLALCAPASANDAPEGAKLYEERCAPCHTVGGGELSGPDLLAATAWPREQLHEAVERMEENCGPMTDAQVDALVDLLKDSKVRQILAGPVVPAAPVQQRRGSAENGRALFFGDRALANGGSPCFACHALGGRGGNLARDLTTVSRRLGENALFAATEQPAFPLMKASYTGRPVTAAEAADLVAFIRAGAAVPAARNDRIDIVQGAAGGLALVVIGAVGLVARRRRAGLRARLVRKSQGGRS